MKRIGIVLVTYNPDIKVLYRTVDELNKKNLIYIFDNGSKNADEIRNVLSELKNVHILFNSRNLGIAEAQNNTIKRILENYHCSFLFFLDQDSYIAESVLEQLVFDYNKCKEIYPKIACIAAVSKFASKNLNERYELASEVISSGMLIPVESIKSIGLMKADFFIDMVDYEWCWRAIDKGWTIIQDNKCLFTHQIGDSENKVLNKVLIAPFRLYYVYRNSIYILKNFSYGKNKEIKYKLFKQFIFNCVFCPQKKQRFKYIILGIKDGMKNRLGKLEYER